MFDFELSETHDLENFCRQYNCKPFQVFLTTMQTLLHRYTSQKEIVIETRTAPGSSDPERFLASLENSSTFRDLLDLNQKSEKLFSNQESEKILLEALEPREPGLTPLYLVGLNMWDESIQFPSRRLMRRIIENSRQAGYSRFWMPPKRFIKQANIWKSVT
jgi:hypothetical protein